ncbi:MAG: DNA polymerase III subunit gamma/tau, partial [Firmicutes bacterium]|nr:DNA polymerase III subunit gamma/tau [Bacillota bacterium]
QSHITTTLTNQIKSGKIRHAYLFTGSRGTGKTTSARIFASAVNCLTPKNGSPCYECETCSLLKSNVHADILEIDAASNNKVDEVRALRDTINFAPVSSKYKVYIIDEVHMLTDSAFNALLKTLEEPPQHVIFILGTTEVHKLPATILSRCMRFDFHLVSRENLKNHLAGILKKENKAFEEDAIDYIASLAEGSVRDSISLLDTCLGFSDGTLTTQNVLEVLGAVDKKKIFELFECIASGDIGNALRITHELEFEGKSMAFLAKELVYHARDLLVTKTLGTTLIKGTREHLDYFVNKSKEHGKGLLVELIAIFSTIDSDLRYAVNPKIVLQAAIIKACALTMPVETIEKKNIVETKIEVEKKNKLIEVADIVVKNDSPPPLVVDEDFGLEPPPLIIQNEKFRTQNFEQVNAPTSKESSFNNPSSFSLTTSSPLDIWGKLITYFRRNNDMQSYNIVLGKGKNIFSDGDELIARVCDEDFMLLNDPNVHHKINDALKTLNFPFRLRVEKVKMDIIDMDKEIYRLKEMADGVKININYK